MMTALSLLSFAAYVICSILVCRHRRRTGGARCGWGKSALMPLLALFVWTSLYSPLRFLLTGRELPANLFPGDRAYIFVIAGLLFGCIGDTLLEIGGKWYGPGAAAFLMGHLCYLHAAGIQIRAGGGVKAPMFLLALFYLIPVIAAGRALLASVHGMIRIGMASYMAAILAMSFSMLLRFGLVPLFAFVCCFAGSIFFLISDGWIGCHAFLGRDGNGIMETYTIAQALLALGFVLAM
ncbi:MAG: lysoplasmalogenase family protein [Lachnospiraceae bacterium]